MKKYKCDSCKFVSRSRKKIRQHVKEVHKIKCEKNDIKVYNKYEKNTSYKSPVSAYYTSENE